MDSSSSYRNAQIADNDLWTSIRFDVATRTATL
jgi:hypothetical protein